MNREAHFTYFKNGHLLPKRFTVQLSNYRAVAYMLYTMMYRASLHPNPLFITFLLSGAFPGFGEMLLDKSSLFSV